MISIVIDNYRTQQNISIFVRKIERYLVVSLSERQLSSTFRAKSMFEPNPQPGEMFHEEVNSDIKSFVSWWGERWGLLSQLPDSSFGD